MPSSPTSRSIDFATASGALDRAGDDDEQSHNDADAAGFRCLVAQSHGAADARPGGDFGAPPRRGGDATSRLARYARRHPVIARRLGVDATSPRHRTGGADALVRAACDAGAGRVTYDA